MRSANRAPYIFPPFMIYGFFAVGLIASIAVRMIIIFQHLQPSWIRPTWYVAVAGNIIFFMYRYYITRRRKNALAETEVISKLERGETLGKHESEVVLYVLRSTEASLEDVNYGIIFLFSFIAIVADIILSMN
jgi:hypothetical protein